MEIAMKLPSRLGFIQVAGLESARMKNGACRQQTRFYYSTSESIMKTAMLFTASLALSSLSAVAGAGQALQLTPAASIEIPDTWSASRSI
jgi:hypothetical protein